MGCACTELPRRCVCGDGMVYVAFLAVGTSCGWFVMNGLSNLIANEPDVAQGGKMMGEVALFFIRCEPHSVRLLCIVDVGLRQIR
mmetsp:Transcript_65827/g.154995  ORF Transcript_65827/g.154995 Transcript_65827/m.154995 type:complete len:85 (+) Transcript_65827:70-324(+)